MKFYNFLLAGAICSLKGTLDKLGIWPLRESVKSIGKPRHNLAEVSEVRESVLRGGTLSILLKSTIFVLSILYQNL